MSCPNINSSEFKQTESLIGKQNTYKLFMLTNDYVLDIQENDSPNTAIQKLKLKYNSNEFGNISDSNYQNLVNEINSYNSDSKKINIDQKEDGTYKLSIVGNTIQKPNSNIQVEKNPLNIVARIENNKPLRLPAEKLGFNQEFRETHSKINFILGKIINQGNCSEEYKFLASFLKGLPNEFKDGDVRAVEGLKRQKGRDGEFGETSHRISVDDSLSEEQMITAFLHEMLHMFTSDVLKNPQTEKQKEIKRAIEVLRQNVKSYYEQQLGFEITEDNIKKNLEDLRPYYGLINVDEFISELFTNKSFQRLLSNSAFSESKSFLQRIAELLRELIEDISGFKFSKQNNIVLDSAINNSLRLISDITSVPIGINISENTLGSLSDNIIKEGVKEVFKENSELASIGTQEQYSQYLDTIFPDSKVKDIVYHGTDAKFDKFDKSFIGSKGGSQFGSGFYFSNTVEYVNKILKSAKVNHNNVISAVLNIKNPSKYDFFDIGDFEEFSARLEHEKTAIRKERKEDGLISVADENTEYVVEESEQIHILGSKKDVEGFKEFVTQPTTQSVKSGVSELFESNTELANQVYESLGFKQELTFIKSDNTIDDDFYIKDILIVTKELQNIRTNNFDGSINRELSELKAKLNTLPIGSKFNVSEYTNPTSTNLEEVLSRINLSESNKILLEKIRPLIKDVKIEYVNKFILANSGAVYSDKYNTIRLNKSEKNIPLEELLMHELLHAATFRKITYFETNTKGLSEKELLALNELENIRKVLKEASDKYWDNKPRFARSVNPLEGYRTDSIHEIISYAFTNKEFRDAITEIPYKGNKSILDKLVELIANIFGVKQHTILNALLANAEVLLENTQITPQQKQQALQLYSQYLDTIFPSSKIKDIVYHGTNSEFDKFEKTEDFSTKESLLANVTKKMIHFFSSKNIEKNFHVSQKYTKSVLLNIKNPLIKVDEFWNYDNALKIAELKKETIDKDGIILSFGEKTKEYYPDLDNEKGYVVFEPEQIHILGSKQDIKGFKEFVKDKSFIFDENTKGSLSNSTLKDNKKLLNEFQKDLLNRKNKLEESLHKEKNTKRKESLTKRIEVLKDQLTQLTNNNHYTTIVEIATENLAYVKQLMSKPNLTDSDIIEVQNFIALYKDTTKYLEDDFKFTNELDENGIVTQYKTDIFNSFEQIDAEAKRLDSLVFNIECDFLLKQYEKLFGTSITKEDLYKITKDVGDIENNFRSAGSFGVKLLEMQEVIIRLANNRANDKRTEIVKQNTTLFEKVKQNALFIEKGFSALLDKDDNGKWNGKVLTKFNKKYWTTYYNIFKGTKTKKGLTELLNKKNRTESENQQIEEHFDSYNDNHFIVDYTKLQDDNYKNEIIKRFGIVHGNNLLSQAETKYTKYVFDREGYIDYLNANFPNFEQRDKKLYDWEIYHSPIRLMQTLQGDRQLTSYGLLPKSYHWGYFTATPLEQHFNEDYNVLEQPENVDLLNYLNFTNDVLGDLRNLAPDKLFEKESFSLNSLPIVAKDLMQKYAKDGMLSSLTSSVGDWLKSFVKHTQKENQKSVDEYTGKDSYNLGLQGISNSSIREFNVSTGKYEINRDKQSDNIFDILNYTAGTIALYQNKLDFEDSHKMIVRAMNHIGTEQYGHNANKDELKNVKSVADFYNKNYYGISNEVGGEVERKIYTKEEDRKNKEINTRINDITDLLDISLENKLNSKKGIEELKSKLIVLEQKLQLEDINTPLVKEKLASIKELNKLIEVKEGLGSNFSFGQTGRSVLKWVQTKAMGFNLFSGINEVMFGMVTTFNYATGQEIYNEKDWGNAFSTMLRFRNGTEDVKKIHKLLEKFNLIKNSMVENIDSNPMNNTLFFLQKNAEAFTRGITMVSVLNNIKLQGIDGKEVSLFNVLDSEGNIDKKLVTPDEYVNWTTGDVTKMEQLNIKVQTLVSSLHGNYDSDTPIKAKQSFWGMASLQFRTWLLEGIANRGQDEHFDSRLGLIVKGRYKTMNNSTAWIALLKRFAFISDKNNEELQSLSQVDKANIRKNATELIFLLTVSAAILALKHLGDDDEDDKEWTLTNLMLNNMLRLQQDLAFYINPNEVESLNSKIIPATVIMNDFAQLMDAYYDTVLGEGTYKTGMYSGESKVFKETLQFFPVTNQYYKFDYLARQTMDKIK